MFVCKAKNRICVKGNEGGLAGRSFGQNFQMTKRGVDEVKDWFFKIKDINKEVRVDQVVLKTHISLIDCIVIVIVIVISYSYTI